MNDKPQETTDPTQPTRLHIARVQELISEIGANLVERAVKHDASKLLEPEVSLFNKASSALHGLTYGSEEYKRQIKDILGPAVEHHYAHNSHHPEHWDIKGNDGQWVGLGIRRMSLLDQLEMLADWKAAGERHGNGSLCKSFEVNRTRFRIPDDQFFLLCKTAMELNWLTVAEFERLTEECNPTLVEIDELGM